MLLLARGSGDARDSHLEHHLLLSQLLLLLLGQHLLLLLLLLELLHQESLLLWCEFLSVATGAPPKVLGALTRSRSKLWTEHIALRHLLLLERACGPSTTSGRFLHIEIGWGLSRHRVLLTAQHDLEGLLLGRLHHVMLLLLLLLL